MVDGDFVVFGYLCQHIFTMNYHLHCCEDKSVLDPRSSLIGPMSCISSENLSYIKIIHQQFLFGSYY